jgi:small-conductance mechanosensitive channel
MRFSLIDLLIAIFSIAIGAVVAEAFSSFLPAFLRHALA